MARRSDHTREQLKALILETAWQLIGAKGYEGLTVRGIAEQIGYAPGTIYNLFKSMDDLALHINARTVETLYGVLSDPRCQREDRTPVENMKTMAKAYMDFSREYRPYWLMLFNYALPDDRKTLPWYQEKIDRLFAPLENLLAPYFPAGEGRQKTLAARVLWSSVHGLCFLQETGKINVVKSDGDIPDMADYLIDTFAKGLSRK